MKNKLSDLLKTLGLDRDVTAIRGLNTKNPVFTLDNGVEITVTPTNPTPVETVEVAYFGYPDSEVPTFRTSRRVIVTGDNTDSRYICGLDVDDNYQYKKFLRRRMTLGSSVTQVEPASKYNIPRK